MELKDFFLKQKQALRARTRQILGLVRPEHLDFRSAADALTIREMLQHMATSEEGVRRAAVDGDFSYYETRIPQGLRATLGPPPGLDQLKAELERVHQETLAIVEALPPAFLDEERARDHLNFRRRVGVILMGINEHEVHHRAQLMMCLRMLGSPAREPFEKK